MKLRFNRAEMADALSAITGVAAVRTPKEILKCVRIDALSDVLLLSATDLEIGVRCAVTQVDVESTGETLVAADTFSRIIHECSDETMLLDISKNDLQLRGSGSHFKIRTQSVSDFPPVPVLEGEPDFVVDAADLRRLLEWTSFAAARESTRYAINGILMEIAGKELVMAATDGRRLSVGRTPLTSSNVKTIPQTIVPTKTAALIARLHSDGDTTALVKATANQVLFKIGRASISSSLVEGMFPRYQDVVPTDCDRIVQLNTMEFLSALKRAALLTNEESRGVRLSFAENTLTLSSRTAEQGEATISMPIRYNGETVDIGFNPVFLTDVLRVANEEEVTFAVKEPNRPGLLKLNDKFLHVVMPVNLSSA
ncbi:MAG: DNA polymerase III subunit beta [Planctomycetes bacterium]|nr:DNA polymerase III subunit beta [Planctomycetota bacterium]MBI3834319.1 DNA polymerase III subunit beta [Planctomycetota bacterium]